MITRNTAKLYAAYKSGFLGEDRLETYFSFLANIIIDNKITEIEITTINRLFQERYRFELPLGFIRQVLSVGVRNGSIISNRGKYSVDMMKMTEYKFDSSTFERLWDNMISKFKEFCCNLRIGFNAETISQDVLLLMDKTDDAVLTKEIIDTQESTDSLLFAWYSFARHCDENDPDTFSFISSICTSNIAKQALFYNGDSADSYNGLEIYLDSPMVFSLLGIGSPERTEAYKKLISKAQKLGCTILILEHNFVEVEGILGRAAAWATSNEYDNKKANDSARFFHDSGMSKEDMEEFCANAESSLNELGINLKQTDYDVLEDKFQEDETTLYEMVKAKYLEKGLAINANNKDNSIRIDVRSIVMIYRLRAGQVANRIAHSKHLMLTSNNAIANVSKNFESNRSISSGHIPACIAADLFAAILWFSSPAEMQDYNRHRLLADCYKYLQPTPALVQKYLDSLEQARRADDLDEKKFLFLKTHPVVLDALMSVTHGDYARYDDKTYLEVYDCIVETSRKEYYDEAEAHKKTKLELERERDEKKELSKKKDEQIDELLDRIQQMEVKDKEERTKKANRRGWIHTCLLFGIPYIVLLTAGELIKAQFSDFKAVSWIVVGIIVFATILIPILFSKGKDWCFSKAKKKYGI